MIYCVQFSKADINGIYEVIQKMDDFYFTGGLFYFSCKRSIEKVKEMFCDYKVLVMNIDAQKPPAVIAGWVKKILLQEEAKRFEKEQQEGLKGFTKFVEDVREDLERQLQEGGDSGNK